MHRIKQRKGHSYFQESSADEDDKDDEYDSKVFTLSFPKFNAQNLRRIKQRKGGCFIQASSDDEDDQVDDLITSMNS